MYETLVPQWEQGRFVAGAAGGMLQVLGIRGDRLERVAAIPGSHGAGWMLRGSLLVQPHNDGNVEVIDLQRPGHESVFALGGTGRVVDVDAERRRFLITTAKRLVYIDLGQGVHHEIAVHSANRAGLLDRSPTGRPLLIERHPERIEFRDIVSGEVIGPGLTPNGGHYAGQTTVFRSLLSLDPNLPVLFTQDSLGRLGTWHLDRILRPAPQTMDAEEALLHAQLAAFRRIAPGGILQDLTLEQWRALRTRWSARR